MKANKIEEAKEKLRETLKIDPDYIIAKIKLDELTK
jgi:Tfp pilus assembly protein PilF